MSVRLCLLYGGVFGAMSLWVFHMPQGCFTRSCGRGKSSHKVASLHRLVIMSYVRNLQSASATDGSTSLVCGPYIQLPGEEGESFPDGKRLSPFHSHGLYEGADFGRRGSQTDFGSCYTQSAFRAALGFWKGHDPIAGRMYDSGQCVPLAGCQRLLWNPGTRHGWTSLDVRPWVPYPWIHDPDRGGSHGR